MQGTKESHFFFDPPKLGTPPKLEALTVILFVHAVHIHVYISEF